MEHAVVVGGGHYKLLLGLLYSVAAAVKFNQSVVSSHLLYFASSLTAGIIGCRQGA